MRGEEPGSQRPAVAGLTSATMSATTNTTATSVKAIPSPSRSLPPAKTIPMSSAATMMPPSTNQTRRLRPPCAGAGGCTSAGAVAVAPAGGIGG